MAVVLRMRQAASVKNNGADRKSSGVGHGSPRSKAPPLPANASPIQLSNTGVQSLKQGNLPYAFRCLNAAAKLVMNRRTALNEKKKKQAKRRSSRPPPAPLTIVTRSSKAKADAESGTGACEGSASLSFPSSVASKRTLANLSGTSSFRYDWLDCTQTYRAVKRYADANYNINSKPSGMGTDFLCLRFVVVVPSSGRGSKVRMSKCDEDACSWVVFYNAAMVFHLVAEQRGEYGSNLLPKAQALWQIAGSHVNGMCNAINHKNGPDASMSQWHMARLLVWNGLAALYHERAMTADALKMTRLVSGHVAGCNSRWVEHGQWTSNDLKRDSWICRLLLTHALAVSACRTAGAA